jgi:hypothetical protein
MLFDDPSGRILDAGVGTANSVKFDRKPSLTTH